LERDLVGRFRPDEGLGVGIVLVEVVADRLLELGDAGEGATEMRFVVISAKKRSTRFSHEALVGVRCRWKRRRVASHAFTWGVLWVP
jgi:hypothetical protein